MTRLTFAEAQDFFSTAWLLDWSELRIRPTHIAADLPGLTLAQVRQEVDSFLASIGREIDPASITITDDSTDEPAVQIVTLKIEF